jgi:hypothetical protein
MAFTNKFKKSEFGFKLSVDLLHDVCTQNNLEFDAVWSHVSSKDVDSLKKFHRRERKKNDPLALVKRHRTAFSFFTQERRNKIAENNPTLTFGEVSKLVGEEWRGLDEQQKLTYKSLELDDRKRYDTDRDEIMKDLASKQVVDDAVVSDDQVVEGVSSASVVDSSVVVEEGSSVSVESKSKGKSKGKPKVKQVKSVVKVVPEAEQVVAAVESVSPVEAEQVVAAVVPVVEVKAKKLKKSRQAVAASQ